MSQVHRFDILHSALDSVEGIRDEDLRHTTAILALAGHSLAGGSAPAPAG
jgi:hypothetical protein